MTILATTSLLGVEDFHQDAAGVLTQRTRCVNGTYSTFNVTPINAATFNVLDAASETAHQNMGGAATFPGPAIAELTKRTRAAVADIATLKTLPTAQQVDKCGCYVQAKNCKYYWNAASTTADDGNYTVAPNDVAGGPGRWLKTTAGNTDSALAQYQTVAALRAGALPSNYGEVWCLATGLYHYDPTSTATDDGVNAVQPTAIVGGNPGRYLLDIPLYSNFSQSFAGNSGVITRDSLGNIASVNSMSVTRAAGYVSGFGSSTMTWNNNQVASTS